MNTSEFHNWLSAMLLVIFFSACFAHVALADRNQPIDTGFNQLSEGGASACPGRILGDFNSDCVVDTADFNGVLGAFGENRPEADFNGDGVVDYIDVYILQAVWGSTCGTRLLGDTNGDGQVNSTDLSMLLDNWGTSTPQSDFNQDGTVGQIDLEMLEANWGGTLERRLLGDYTGDELVDVNDLNCLIGNWNPSSSQRELDFILAQWGATSGRNLLGDINGDNLVNGIDQDLLLAVWGTNWPQADLNADGMVGATDLAAVLANFNNTAGMDLSGDINGDWHVTEADQELLLAVWGTDWPQADLNADGTVDGQDHAILLENWNMAFGRQLMGDINGNCEVDTVDLEILRAAWGSDFTQADLDGDGLIDANDLARLLANWGQMCF